MSRKKRSRLRSAGLAVLLLAGGFSTLAGPAEAASGFGFSGGLQGGSSMRSPAHRGFARSMPAARPISATGTTVPVPPLQSGFLNQGFVPAITPGFENQGFIPPIAPGFLNEGFIPAISPGFMNEGFIPPLVGSSAVTGQQIGFHGSAFTHRFAGNRRFAREHRFARNHRFGSHRRFFAPFGDFGFDGFGFDNAFLGAPDTAPEFAGPEDFGEASPTGPSVEPVREEQPFAAHDVRVGSGHGAEVSARSRKDSGTVVVMRPGFQDEVVTVPRDAGGG